MPTYRPDNYEISPHGSSGFPQREPSPRALVLMGVCGCGKSTLGAALAHALGWSFVEGDAFHPAANLEKMRTGRALDDADRTPWLAALNRQLAQHLAGAQPCILACSALKRCYREQLLFHLPPRSTGLIYLHGSREQLTVRLAARAAHFMSVALLDSQLATLEIPCADEAALVLEIAQPPEAMVREITTYFGLRLCGAQ